MMEKCSLKNESEQGLKVKLLVHHLDLGKILPIARLSTFLCKRLFVMKKMESKFHLDVQLFCEVQKPFGQAQFHFR